MSLEVFVAIVTCATVAATLFGYVVGYLAGQRSLDPEVASLRRQIRAWTDLATLANRISESARQSWQAALSHKEAAIAKLWLENRELRERCGETADE